MNIDQQKLEAYEKHLDKAIKALIDESAALVSHEETIKAWRRDSSPYRANCIDR